MSTTLTATDINNNCSVTNNAGVDVMALDAYTEAGVTKVEQMYEQTLKLIKNGSQDVITSGSTGTIVLNDTHVDKNGTTQPNSLYNVLLVRPGTYFPVKATAVTLSLAAPRSLSPITISADDARNMSLAENFWQTILAYPTSQMAQDFTAAVSNSTSTATTATQIDSNVSNFFKNKTREFTTLGLNNVVAVQTYYSQFPLVWADYKASKTYYLYTSDGAKTSYAGSVALNLPASVINADKQLPASAITFTNASGAQKRLYYQDGLFTDDTSKDVPAISLKGLFTLKSSLTKDTADNTIIGILSGKVDNKDVIGYPEKLQQDEHGDWSGMYTLLHPKNCMDLLNLLGEFMMVVMFVEMLGKGAGWLKDKFTSKKVEKNGTEPSPSEVEQLRSEFKAAQQQMTEANQKLLDKFDSNLKMTDDLNSAMKDLQQKMENRFNEEQRSSLQESLNKEGELLDSAAQYEVTPNMEDMADTIAGDLGTLETAKTAELHDVLPQVQVDVVNLNIDLASEVKNITEAMGTEAREQVKRTQEELKTAEETADNIEKSASEARERRTPEEPEFEAKGEFL